MSDILDMAHDMAKDLHALGAMDAITMRMVDELCLPPKRSGCLAAMPRAFPCRTPGRKRRFST